jgi:hypothetical protein
MSGVRLSRPVASRRPSARDVSVCAGLSFLAASAGIAVWRVAAPLPHGWWLVSFLALVGGVAQLLLTAGDAALVRSRSSIRARGSPRRRLVLWNAGTLLVPVGVLAAARLAVVLGSALLVAALAAFSLELLGARSARDGPAPHWHLAYAALLAFLAASVVVGTALAWDLPWT